MVGTTSRAALHNSPAKDRQDDPARARAPEGCMVIVAHSQPNRKRQSAEHTIRDSLFLYEERHLISTDSAEAWG